MTKYARVDGYPNLVRDLDTNAIINTDKLSSISYDNLRKKKEDSEIRLEHIESDLNELKSSIEEIKTLMRSILK